MKRKPKLGKTVVTFDNNARADIWQIVLTKANNVLCPFCAKEVTEETFGGAAFIDGKLRIFHNNVICILEFGQLEADSE